MSMELNNGTATLSPEKLKRAKKVIIIFSIVIPVAVAALFGIHIDGVDLSFLPPIYASINGLTAILLVAALVAIKRKNMNLHRALMRACLFLSLLFLLAYVAYHITSEPTAYQGSIPGLYYPLLIAHVLLSVIVIPLVLLTYLWAWEGDYQKHKRWTKISFPIWLFVAVSGVVVYLMISPYYG